MYSNLTLYYLNQLGITPWVIKSRAIKEEGIPKLMVISPENISKKAQILLKRMLDFLGFPFELIHNATDYKHWDNPLLAVLILGIDGLDLHVNCPVFSSMNPEFLLENPAYKKQAFKELSCVKEQIG